MEAVQFKTTLDWTSKKFKCPQCGKNTFVRFRDRENGEYLSDQYGRCDREMKCGYFQQPDKEIQETTFVPVQPKPRVYFPYDVFAKTLTGYENNTFFKGAVSQGVPADRLTEILQKYKCGTLTKGKYKGAICFPYVNRYGQLEAVQCKTFKDDFHTYKTNWLHSILQYGYKVQPQWLTEYLENETKFQCLFGEHLLREDHTAPVIVVESPKNAILGSLLLPEYIWLSSFNLSALKAKKLRVLKGRQVILIPDTSKDAEAFDKWRNVADEAENLYQTKFEVLRYFEEKATPEQKAKGYDIADYIVDHIQEMEADILQRNTKVRKNHIAENQQVTEEKSSFRDEHSEEKSSIRMEHLERIKVGLSFNTDELKELARRMIPENDSRTAKELLQMLKELEGLEGENAKDLLLTMRINDVIDKTSLGTYFLSDSTPF